MFCQELCRVPLTLCVWATALCIVTPVIFVKEMLSVDAAMKVISFLRRMTVKLEYHLAVMFLMSLMSHM